MAENQFRTPPNGPVIRYAESEVGKIIAVDAAGILSPANASSVLRYPVQYAGLPIIVGPDGYAIPGNVMPPNQYGDGNVARSWVTNNSVYDVISLGDSTQAYNAGACADFLTNVTWVGGTFGMLGDIHNQTYNPNVIGTNQVTGGWFQAPPLNRTTPVASILAGVETYVDDYDGGLIATEALIGANTTFGNYYGVGNCVINRLLSFIPLLQGSMGPTTPWFGWDNWLASHNTQDMYCELLLRMNPSGVNANALTVQASYDYTAAHTVQGAASGSYAAAKGYKSISATLPGADRGTTGIVVVDLCGIDNTSVVLGTNIAVAYSKFRIPGNGKLIHSWASGGQAIEGYLNKSLAPDDFWLNVIPTILGVASVPLFWIDLGTNNPNNDDAVQFATKLRQLIGRCRLAYPSALVLVTTAHPTQGEVAPTYFQTGAIQVARDTPGVLCIDTWTMSPSYDAAVAAGDMADTAHYNQQGNEKWFGRLNTALGQWL